MNTSYYTEEVSVSTVDPYIGEIVTEQDGFINPNLQNKLVEFIEDKQKEAMEERPVNEGLLAGINIALSKIKRSNGMELRLTDFKNKILIGYGTFGSVWKATHPTFGDVALKQIEVKFEDIPRIWKERDVSEAYKDKRICKMMGAFVETDVFFISELCHGSVSSLRNKISPRNCVRFVAQMMEGIGFLHGKNIIHGDIKPDNCLINSKNNLVICDFGSVIFKEGRVVFNPGTLGFMDYRATKENYFCKKSDVFGAATVIYELDLKNHLLLYVNREQTSSVYIDAFENGRVKCLWPNMEITPDLERELLSARVARSRFGMLMTNMIRNDSKRFTIFQCQMDDSFKTIIQREGVSGESLDKSAETEFVSRDYTVDFGVEFEPKTMLDVNSDVVRASLFGFTYVSKEYDGVEELPVQQDPKIDVDKIRYMRYCRGSAMSNFHRSNHQ